MRGPGGDAEADLNPRKPWLLWGGAERAAVGSVHGKRARLKPSMRPFCKKNLTHAAPLPISIGPTALALWRPTGCRDFGTISRRAPPRREAGRRFWSSCADGAGSGCLEERSRGLGLALGLGLA
jgi:hypothetical protein